MSQDLYYKQWTLKAGDDNYQIVNADGGVEKFYKVVMGPYGNPMIIIEPTLAFSVPEGLTYVNSKAEEVIPAEKIGGIICQETDGAAKFRFSLSNPNAPAFSITDDGIEIDGEKWYLAVLFSKDKNRTFNYDAFFVRQKPTQVKLLELADLNFSLL